jgi:hypothetical protein
MRLVDCLECKDLDRSLKLTLASYMTALLELCTTCAPAPAHRNLGMI